MSKDFLFFGQLFEEAIGNIRSIGGEQRYQNRVFDIQYFLEEDGIGINILSEWILPGNWAVILHPENWVQRVIMPYEQAEKTISTFEFPPPELKGLNVFSISHGNFGEGFNTSFRRRGFLETLDKSLNYPDCN